MLPAVENLMSVCSPYVSPSYCWIRYLRRYGTNFATHVPHCSKVSPVKTVTARPVHTEAHHHIDVYSDINYLK